MVLMKKYKSTPCIPYKSTLIQSIPCIPFVPESIPKLCNEALKRVSSTFQADFPAYPDISSITNSCDT